MAVIVRVLKLVVSLLGESTAAVLTQMPFAAPTTRAVALPGRTAILTVINA